MKIFLIIPPVTVSAKEYIPINGYPFLGVGYIAAVLEQAGYEVGVLDAFTTENNKVIFHNGKATYGLDDISIKSQIEKFNPDVVGISSMYTVYAQDAHRMAKITKEISKDILVVFGGSHPSCSPEFVLNDDNVDVIVKGEGENTFLEIVNAFKNGKDIYNIPGSIVKKDGSIFVNKPRPLIEDLDTLPFPARHLLPMQSYLNNAAHSIYSMRGPFATMITSRGCPMNCVYCAVRTIWGRTWRSRSPVKVVDEIEYIIRNYGVREIHFSDDNISVNKNRITQICSEIINRKINIRWAAPTGIAIWSLDEDVLRVMKKAGCYRLTFGLESGNRQTLDFIGKKYSYDKAKELIKIANKLGFWTAATFIFGFPDEKQESINDTISLALNSNLDFSVFYTPVVIPGTRLFDIYEDSGIKFQQEITGISNAYDSLHFSKEDLLRMRAEANAKFIKKRLRDPFSIFSKVRSIEDFFYVLRIGGNFFKNLLVNRVNIKNAFGLLHKTTTQKH